MNYALKYQTNQSQSDTQISIETQVSTIEELNFYQKSSISQITWPNQNFSPYKESQDLHIKVYRLRYKLLTWTKDSEYTQMLTNIPTKVRLP